MKNQIVGSWKEVLNEELEREYFKKLIEFVEKEYQAKPDSIFPKKEEVFNAFTFTPFEKVKVVILGQDPYHGEGQAHGLSFSFMGNRNLPPSLKNIFKVLMPGKTFDWKNQSGDLTKWAENGVLLLNSILTVEKGMPGSHKNMGWENFTDRVIQTISDKKENVVFILWGNYAKEKKKLIDEKKHKIIESTHPASRFQHHITFMTHNPFVETNTYLKKNNLEEIDWQI